MSKAEAIQTAARTTMPAVCDAPSVARDGGALVVSRTGVILERSDLERAGLKSCSDRHREEAAARPDVARMEAKVALLESQIAVRGLDAESESTLSSSVLLFPIALPVLSATISNRLVVSW